MTDPAADLQRARTTLTEAELTAGSRQRFQAAYAVALQTAAVVLACRSRPGLRPTGRPRNVWRVLAAVAPELAEWAAFFAVVQAQQGAVAEGHLADVTPRQADDLVRDAAAFLAVVRRRVDARRPEADDASATGGHARRLVGSSDPQARASPVRRRPRSAPTRSPRST